MENDTHPNKSNSNLLSWNISFNDSMLRWSQKYVLLYVCGADGYIQRPNICSNISSFYDKILLHSTSSKYWIELERLSIWCLETTAWTNEWKICQRRQLVHVCISKSELEKCMLRVTLSLREDIQVFHTKNGTVKLQNKVWNPIELTSKPGCVGIYCIKCLALWKYSFSQLSDGMRNVRRLFWEKRWCATLW